MGDHTEICWLIRIIMWIEVLFHIEIVTFARGLVGGGGYLCVCDGLNYVSLSRYRNALGDWITIKLMIPSWQTCQFCRKWRLFGKEFQKGGHPIHSLHYVSIRYCYSFGLSCLLTPFYDFEWRIWRKQTGRKGAQISMTWDLNCLSSFWMHWKKTIN